MSEQENIKVVQANYEPFNAHELDTFSQLRAADFMGEETGAPAPQWSDKCFKANRD